MAVTGLVDEKLFEQELAIFLRNQDIFSISTRGVSTITEEFDGDTVEDTFTLSKADVKNVRSVTVGGVAQTEWTDYEVTYGSHGTLTTVVFAAGSIPGTGTNNVDVIFDHGTDKIYSGRSRTDLSISSYPRIAVWVLSAKLDVIGLNAAANVNDLLVNVQVWADSKDDVQDYMKAAESALLGNKKDFYYTDYIEPVTKSPVLPQADRNDKIETQILTLRAPFNEILIS